MPAEFPTITSTEDVDALFDRSRTAPVVIFKHDPYCPISAAAYGQMAQVEGDVALVDVANNADVTGEITKRTGIRHESPQVIVLRDGKTAWSASHFAIKARAVTDAAQ